MNKKLEKVEKKTENKKVLAEKKVSSFKKKKKVKRNVTSGIAYVYSTFNNTIISIADESGNVVSWSSAGAKGFKGSRKSTPYAAQVAADDAGAAGDTDSEDQLNQMEKEMRDATLGAADRKANKRRPASAGDGGPAAKRPAAAKPIVQKKPAGPVANLHPRFSDLINADNRLPHWQRRDFTSKAFAAARKRSRNDGKSDEEAKEVASQVGRAAGAAWDRKFPKP